MSRSVISTNVEMWVKRAAITRVAQVRGLYTSLADESNTIEWAQLRSFAANIQLFSFSFSSRSMPALSVSLIISFHYGIRSLDAPLFRSFSFPAFIYDALLCIRNFVLFRFPFANILSVRSYVRHIKSAGVGRFRSLVQSLWLSFKTRTRPSRAIRTTKLAARASKYTFAKKKKKKSEMSRSIVAAFLAFSTVLANGK